MAAYSLGRKPQVDSHRIVSPRVTAAARCAGSMLAYDEVTWGLRPRLYAAVRFADLCNFFRQRDVSDKHRNGPPFFGVYFISGGLLLIGF